LPISSFAKLVQIMSQSAQNRKTLILLLTALLMRAGIPDGYMPSAPGSRLLFELCPAGVPAGFMLALGGTEHHHHDDEADASQSHFDAGQCPIGHLLSSTIAFDNPWQLDATPALASFVAAPVRTNISRAHVRYRSRGPPA